MKEIMIDAKNADVIEYYGETLASIYKYDFGRAPWYEKSKCDNTSCKILFTGKDTGTACTRCGNCLVDAYASDDLIAGWKKIVSDEDGLIELAVTENDVPVRMTIARPTNPSELYARKYDGVSEMKTWIPEKMPEELVWIEDTFANLQANKEGNLVNRGATIGTIAARYSGLLIATRTLSPAIVRATVRDVAECTDVYIGSQQVGDELAGTARSISGVPDRRTLLAVDGKELV